MVVVVVVVMPDDELDELATPELDELELEVEPPDPPVLPVESSDWVHPTNAISPRPTPRTRTSATARIVRLPARRGSAPYSKDIQASQPRGENASCCAAMLGAMAESDDAEDSPRRRWCREGRVT